MFNNELWLTLLDNTTLPPTPPTDVVVVVPAADNDDNDHDIDDEEEEHKDDDVVTAAVPVKILSVLSLLPCSCRRTGSETASNDESSLS